MGKGRHEGKKGRHEPGSPEQGRHRGQGGDNTSDPQTCAHLGHDKSARSGGGYERHCSSCDTTWWTPG